MISVRNLRDHIDWPLIVTTSAIAVVGVVNLYSATSAAGAAKSELYLQQIYWLFLGGGVAALLVAFDYRYLEKQGWVIYAVGIFLLLLVFLLGRNVRGSQRWIPIGSFSLQPSELIKLSLIIALAKYLHHDTKVGGRSLKDLVAPGLILALPMVLILAQPDLGTAVLCALIFGTIMLLTELKWRSLFTLIAAFLLSAPLTWSYVLQDYQRERLTAFINPEKDLLDSGWHAYQSLVAIGSGGLLGKGFLKGTQSQFRFLPDEHTDFPFPVWAEEHGLWGSLAVLGLYFFLVLWGVKIASQAKDRFGAVVAIGVSAMFFWHTMINIGMVSGMLPVVGVTLPLFSYGGSSVLSFMVGVGLLMSISVRRFHF